MKYIAKLKAWKASQVAALRAAECIRDLAAMDASRAAELPAIDAAIAERRAYIADIDAKISAAKIALERSKISRLTTA